MNGVGQSFNESSLLVFFGRSLVFARLIWYHDKCCAELDPKAPEGANRYFIFPGIYGGQWLAEYKARRGGLCQRNESENDDPSLDLGIVRPPEIDDGWRWWWTIGLHQELAKFGTYIVRKFADVSTENRKVFAELLFWKTARDATEIEMGYGNYKE